VSLSMSKRDPRITHSEVSSPREGLDEQRIKGIEAKWAAESEERIDAVERGELQTVDGPSALGRLRSCLQR
jgi:hypothetical protein